MSAVSSPEHKIAVSSANIEVVQLNRSGKSYVKILYNIENEPWGQPVEISFAKDEAFINSVLF